MKKIISIIAVSVAVAGCTMNTQMTVDVTDHRGNQVKGANVMVDGRNIGQTPNATVEVSNLVGSLPVIRVWKDGYIAVQREAAGEVKVWSLVGGIFLLVPFAWVYGPRAHQHVTLVPEMILR